MHAEDVREAIRKAQLILDRGLAFECVVETGTLQTLIQAARVWVDEFDANDDGELYP